MSAGGEKQAIGKFRRVGEPRRQRMRLEMIDSDERLLVGERDGLGGGESDNDAADQAGPGGGSDAVERGEGRLRLLHRFGYDAVERFDMGAGGNLRHHAAKLGMLADLRQYDVGQNPPLAVGAALDHGGRRFIACGFDAENNHRCIIWVA